VRILFASTRGTGHFTPLVPFVDACIRGGHEVMVAGPPPLAPTVERAGYPFWEGAEPPEDELGATWGRVPTVSPEEANEIVIGEIFGGLNVRAMLPSLEAACEEWQPDALIREEAEFASAIAAERHGVQHARVGVSLSGLEGTALEIAGPGLDEHHRGTAERIWASPYLTYVPAPLDDPERALPPTMHRFSDPAAGAPGDPLPDWWPGDSRPLVYVSFGSVAGTMPVAGALYAAVYEAAAELPARVLLTLGQPDADLEALGPVPANLRVERWVNPADVLAHADAAVSHGGFGTTLGAVAAGLPLVVVPLFGDQPDNARRIEAVGAGLAIWPDPDGPPMPIRTSIDPAPLREAVETVLGDPAYGRVASKLAAEMAALPPVDEALGVFTDAG
jgi:UDP:flavonoid glycosyltransferase YjiC (YdhE family)